MQMSPSDLKLETRLARKVAQANQDFQLIEDGDRIMVGLSGGKDSWVLLHMLARMRRVAPIHFDLLPFHLDQGHPGFPTHLISQTLEAMGYDEYVIHAKDTYSVVKEKLRPGQTTCSLCSRLRRGIMYTQAQELGCNKIALGHHRDDMVETLLLNIFFSGQLKSMPPKLFSDDGHNTVIRPLAYCAEAEVAKLAQGLGVPLIPCTLCSSQDGLQRNAMKSMLDQLEARYPEVRNIALASMANVRTTHLLDRDLYDPNRDQRAPVTTEELKAALL